jgi:hypothetical protein
LIGVDQKGVLEIDGLRQKIDDAHLLKTTKPKGERGRGGEGETSTYVEFFELSG